MKIVPRTKMLAKFVVHDVEGIGITRFETLFAVILAIITLHPCQFIQFTSCRFYLRCSMSRQHFISNYLLNLIIYFERIGILPNFTRCTLVCQ